MNPAKICLMSTLYLIPNHIAFDDRQMHLDVPPAIQSLRCFFVEEPKSARALLKQIDAHFPLQECAYHPLNEHTSVEQIRDYAKMLTDQDTGLISESGCPCVADPGAELVRLAHDQGVKVVPLVGPSSILLALMASGLNGQNFAFNGYLPIDSHERLVKIKALQDRSLKEKQTQIFMETPYRNNALWETLLTSLHAQTSLCLALDIGGASQRVETKTVQEWRKMNLSLPKKPALFIINASSVM